MCAEKTLRLWNEVIRENIEVEKPVTYLIDEKRLI
jgi:hypothetical protein